VYDEENAHVLIPVISDRNPPQNLSRRTVEASGTALELTLTRKRERPKVVLQHTVLRLFCRAMTLAWKLVTRSSTFFSCTVSQYHSDSDSDF